MLLLALEGSGRGFSVALGEAGESRTPRILGSRRDDEPGAGDRLLAHVNELLDSAGLHIDSLEAIVVDRGPGSFTGVRTVVAAGRGRPPGCGPRVFGLGPVEGRCSVGARGAGM